MADDAQREDRTEQASERRLQKAREDGQIAIGRDAIGVAALMGAAVALWQLSQPLLAELVHVVARRSETVALLGPRGGALSDPLPLRLPLLAAGICLSAAVAALACGAIQTQAGFWPDLAMPDFSRLTRGGRLSRLFTREMLVDIGFGGLKVLAIVTAAAAVWREGLPRLSALLQAQPGTLLSGGASWLASGLWRALLVLAGIAAGDVFLQRYRFMARMKMTREESRREQKDDSGDPLMRGRRRRRHRELAKGRAAVEVPRADALVVNPTHIAIAIRYRKSDGRAPRVTAKGKGALAEHMRDLARTHGVPIVEDIALARLLFRRVKVGREVPAETYKAVAAVLAFVYRLTRRGVSA